MRWLGGSHVSLSSNPVNTPPPVSPTFDEPQHHSYAIEADTTPRHEEYEELEEQYYNQ